MLFANLKKVNELLTYAVQLDSFNSGIRTFCDKSDRTAESAKSETKVLKCLCSKTTTVLSEWPIPETMDVSLLHFYCLRNK